MLADLRRLLWQLEHIPCIVAIVAVVADFALFVPLGYLFLRAPADASGRHWGQLGLFPLTLLIMLLASPFVNWFTLSMSEATQIREALYPQRLESLAASMARYYRCWYFERVVRPRLLAIWKRNGVEPGWSARSPDPRRRFR